MSIPGALGRCSMQVLKKMPGKALCEHQTARLDFLNPKEKEICSFPPGIEADQ